MCEGQICPSSYKQSKTYCITLILTILDQTRDGCMQIHERLRVCSIRVTDCYAIIKNALITLHAKYEESKTEKNVLRRYAFFKVSQTRTYYC